MKNILILLFLIFSTYKLHSQTYSGIVSDTLIESVLMAEIENQPKHSDDRNFWKKRIYSVPISWKQAIIKLISKPPYDFSFQKEELINRDSRYNPNLKKITELFDNDDFEYIKKQFYSELKNNWSFETRKSTLKEHPTKNYYTYSIPLFDRKKEKAIIYTEFLGCGSTCGEGQILVYLKKNNKWNLYKKINTWIS